MKALFKALFGGSFGPVQAVLVAALIGFIGYHWTRYHHMESQLGDTRADLAQARTDKFWADFERRWQSQQMTALIELQTKRESGQKYQQATEAMIYEQPKTNDCAGSPSVRVALGRMRDARRSAAGATANADERGPVSDETARSDSD